MFADDQGAHEVDKRSASAEDRIDRVLNNPRGNSYGWCQYDKRAPTRHSGKPRQADANDPQPAAVGGHRHDIGHPVEPARGQIESCAQIECALRPIDLGVLELEDGRQRRFLLPVAVGVEADMVAGAQRNLKNRLGSLAYGIGWSGAETPPNSRYRLTLEDRVVETHAVACIIATTGSLGRLGSLSHGLDPSDGFLDVLVARAADVPTIVSLVASLALGQDRLSPVEQLSISGWPTTPSAASSTACSVATSS